MRYPLAAGLADNMPSRHPAQTDRVDRGPGIRIGAFLVFWITLCAIAAFLASPASGGESTGCTAARRPEEDKTGLCRLACANTLACAKIDLSCYKEKHDA